MNRPAPTWNAPRHPWPCLLFVAPLLLVYEIGLRFLGPAPEELRNGADAWLRQMLIHVGVSPDLGAPAFLLGILVLWCLCWPDSFSHDTFETWIRMIGESVCFAALLFVLSQIVYPLLIFWGGMLDHPSGRFVQVGSIASPDEAWQLMVRYVGAGIYEETLFRLLLFSGLAMLLDLGEVRDGWAILLAAGLSSLLFAGAHHLGNNGEPFNLAVFLFRTFAGLYFACLYHLRGFGVVVGAHAGYDVLVGLLFRLLG